MGAKRKKADPSEFEKLVLRNTASFFRVENIDLRTHGNVHQYSRPCSYLGKPSVFSKISFTMMNVKLALTRREREIESRRSGASHLVKRKFEWAFERFFHINEPARAR